MNDPMTRIELLRLVIGRARSNGFRFRHWYTTHLGEPWINSDTALQLLEQHRRYYSLLFSHGFARSFWKPGSEIAFQVAAQTFQRRMPDGTVATISRKAFTRRNARPDAWRFHLREMALADDPLLYLRRYLLIPETESPRTGVARAQAGCELASVHAARSPQPSRRPLPRPLPEELPAFLRRPYTGQDAASKFSREPELGVNSSPSA